MQAGLLTGDVVGLSACMAVLGASVMFLGMRVRERIPTATYRHWLRRLLAVLAVMLAVQSLSLWFG